LNAGDTKHQSLSLAELIKTLEASDEFSAVVFAVNHVISNNLVWSKTVPTINSVSGFQVIDCNHQGFVAQKSAILISGAFDTMYLYAADSKLMDTVTRNGNYLIDDRVIANFLIGGTSSSNFRIVVDEIARHRKQQNNSYYTKALRMAVFKNYLRLKFLRMIRFLPIKLRSVIFSIRNLFRS
jgi:hypothetical protein